MAAAEPCGICICLSKRELFTELLYKICQQLHLKAASEMCGCVWVCGCVCGCAYVHVCVLLHMLCNAFYYIHVSKICAAMKERGRKD